MTMQNTADDAVPSVAGLVRTGLAPLVHRIDRECLYPGTFLRDLGALRGFSGGVDPSTDHAFNLARQLEITTQVGSVCGSTAFLVWCQSTCAWYLQHAANPPVRARYLDEVVRGELLAGTGMSNAMKHLAGLEKIRLSARREGGHYLVNGILPWVSNLGPGHLLITAAAVEGGGYVMFAVRCAAAGLSLHPCPDFSGMGGTRTFNVRFDSVKVGVDDVLARPDRFDAYIARIKAGFILGQAAMGFGVTEGCLGTIRESNAIHAEVNRLLDDQGPVLRAELDALRARAARLAPQAQTAPGAVIPALKVRAAASELGLRAANSAVLHAGARGYLMRHAAQRQLREAVFVAIVTPALKHLRKEIRDLERGERQVEAA